jgi:hypothetical protein
VAELVAGVWAGLAMIEHTGLWGIDTTPLCTTRCMRLAELLLDGDPYCIDCADETLANEGAAPLFAVRSAEDKQMRPLARIRLP